VHEQHRPANSLQARTVLRVGDAGEHERGINARLAAALRHERQRGLPAQRVTRDRDVVGVELGDARLGSVELQHATQHEAHVAALLR